MKKNKKKSQLADIWVQLKRNKLAVAGLIFIVFLVVVALFADKIAPYSYEAQDLANTFAPPSREHILGTDRLGRDLLSRLIYGSRESLRLGVSATVLVVSLMTLPCVLLIFISQYRHCFWLYQYRQPWVLELTVRYWR